MKKSLLTLTFTALMALQASAQYVEKKEEKSQQNVPLSAWRNVQSQLFNFGWKFQLGNPKGAEKPSFDDSQWRSLDLPHDFQFEQPWNQDAKGARGFKQMCDGWYRKTFRLPN